MRTQAQFGKKKHVKQIEGVQRFVLHARTRNSYKPFQRMKLDTPEEAKNNLAFNDGA